MSLPEMTPLTETCTECAGCYERFHALDMPGSVSAMEVWFMTRDGLTAPEISDRLGKDTAWIRRIQKRVGVKSPRPEHHNKGVVPEEMRPKLEYAKSLLDDEDYSYTAAAEVAGVSKEFLRKHLPGRGWTTDRVIEYAAMGRKLARIGDRL